MGWATFIIENTRMKYYMDVLYQLHCQLGCVIVYKLFDWFCWQNAFCFQLHSRNILTEMWPKGAWKHMHSSNPINSLSFDEYIIRRTMLLFYNINHLPSVNMHLQCRLCSVLQLYLYMLYRNQYFFWMML